MRNNMRDKHLTNRPTLKRDRSTFSCALSLGISIATLLLLPYSAVAEPEDLKWARVDFLSNRVQLVPREQRSRRARISDVLSIGDALRTARASRAELRFNDGSLARIGERATFRFTPSTRNFQLSNGTVLLLIPPGRGRSTVQTPNAVTGIQGSALFVRYIPETDTTIVGALTDNPNGPMVLFNEDGSEQQALRSNEIGVIEGNRITQIYQFDGALFWQTSGLAEGLDYLSSPSQPDNPLGANDPLEGVRQEIREALSNQRPLTGNGVIENPNSFSRPTPPVENVPSRAVIKPVAGGSREQTAVNPSSATDTNSTRGTIVETPTVTTGSRTVENSSIIGPRTSDTSEELDLQVALDLELELELEADGVEAPDLEINETVQQYLEGDTSRLTGSSDVGDSSLQSIDTSETEEESSSSAVGNDSTSTAADSSSAENSEDEVDSGIAPTAGSNSTVTNSSPLTTEPVGTDGGSNDSPTNEPNSNLADQLNSDPSETNSSEPTNNLDAISTDENSPLPAQVSDQLSGQTENPQGVVNDPADSTNLVPDSQLDSSLSVDPAASSNDVDMIGPTVPTSPSDASLDLSSPAELPAAIPLPEIGLDSNMPTNIPGAVIENTTEVSPATVAPVPINVIDIMPAADEPPVQIFMPTDKIDSIMQTMDPEDTMSPEDTVNPDIVSPDTTAPEDTINPVDTTNPDIVGPDTAAPEDMINPDSMAPDDVMNPDVAGDNTIN